EAFEEALAAERPDVIHLQHLMGLPIALVERIDAAGIPYVITLHDYWYGCANAQLLTNDDSSLCAGPDARYINCGRCALARAGVGGLARLAPVVAPLMARRGRLLRRVYEGAAAVLASTDFARRAYAGMGFPTGAVRVWPLGIDVTAEELAAAHAAQRARIAGVSPASSAPLRIGYIGGLSAQKGVHVLVGAVNRLPAGTVALSIYGDLDAFPDYTAELRRMAAHPGIRFEGRLARPAFWPALGGLDVLVVPTLWYETYSIVAHEAFAAGVPVVASRIGVMPEVVRDGVDGLLFPPGDEGALAEILRALAEDRKRVEALRAGIRPVAMLADHCERLLALYAEVMER
ncbi:glycosyltransferase, partial [Promineifilum sp.]|uniref:glycosyltransferase n=1 Tax=Promineifilum sp. TaxID=2664178 RepID=UPI0035AEECA3